MVMDNRLRRQYFLTYYLDSWKIITTQVRSKIAVLIFCGKSASCPVNHLLFPIN